MRGPCQNNFHWSVGIEVSCGRGSENWEIGFNSLYGLVSLAEKRKGPTHVVASRHLFWGGGMQLNCLIPKNLHSLALRANMGPSCRLLIDDSRIPTRNPYFITPLIFHCSRYAWLLWVFASCFVVANMNSFQADSSPLFLNARELSSFSDTVNC